MKQEMNSICENNVYDFVELPEGKRALNSRWVFKRKIASDGSIERYKARLVAQGCSQKFGIDYNETFCPVVRFESIRTVIAVTQPLYESRMNWVHDPAPPASRRATVDFSDTPVDFSDTPVNYSDTPASAIISASP